MFKRTLAAGLVCILGSAASGQTKISGTSQCGKPDKAYVLPAGDRADHAFGLTKVKCTWPRPLQMAGVQLQQDEITVLSEIHGKTSSDRSYVVGTLSNGDKLFVRPVGTAVLVDGHPQSSSGTWQYVGGTGKFAKIRGRGTFRCRSNPSGTSTCDIQGSYQLPKG
ncbi:MAG: hypothetical protein ACJ78K_11075 [Gemmatimonadaceae bacterium]